MIPLKVQHNRIEIINSTNNTAKQETDLAWAPHSPDFNPLDFLLWHHQKDFVYKDSPVTSLDLKDSISNYIQRVIRLINISTQGP